MLDENDLRDDRKLAELVRDGNVGAFNAYRQAFPQQFINFRGEHFTQLVLTGIDLRDVAMREATFLGCSLIRAQFQRAFAVGATFSTCRLDDANFYGCDLQGAQFNAANLHDAYTYAALNLDWRRSLRLLLSSRRWHPAPSETPSVAK
ncbi:MAG: pentapeptide repeat-containing protein [bacterium]|nr:pentapeptide repeat-containing protein [bacterium]